MAQIACPHCKSYNTSKTTMGKITTGTKEIGKASVTVAGRIVGDLLGKALSGIGKWGLNLIPIEFVCNACDSLFTVTFDNDEQVQEITLKKLPLPEKIILRVRDSYIETLKKKRPFTSMIIFSLLTLYCLVCMYLGVAEGSSIKVAISLFFAIPFLIPTILKWRKISSMNKQIKECAMQSPREFKKSHRDLFREYTRYN